MVSTVLRSVRFAICMLSISETSYNRPKEVPAPPLLFSLDVTPTGIDHCWDLSIRAPLLLRNALPMPAQLVLLDSKGTVLCR